MSLPTYNHTFVTELINYPEGLPNEKIDEGLALPRESFIEDLEKLLSDIQNRKEYYYNEVKDKSIDDERLLVRQIFNFLSILKAKESLPKLIEIINEEREFIDFWFGDFIEESYIAFIFYPLFKDNFDFLLEVILKKENHFAVYCGLLNIPAQVAIKEPNRRQEAIYFYKKLSDFVLKQDTQDVLLDELEVDTLVKSILLIEGKELKEQILELCDKELTDDLFGSKTELLKELENPSYSIESDKKIDLELTPYEIFERIVGYNYNCKFTKEEKERYDEQIRKVAEANGIDVYGIINNLNEIDFDNEEEENRWIGNKVFPKSYNPTTNKTLYARNDKVTVKYQDGKIIKDTKYKKVEKDVKDGKCEVIN